MRIRATKRYLILILALLVLASGTVIGCAQGDKASWTEKQVIEYLYGYMMDKARPLQGVPAKAQMIVIEWGFDAAISQANTETLKKFNPRDWGDYVEIELNEPLGLLHEPLRPHIWTGALERLAQYQGNGLWLALIGDSEWLVNETTGEVIAKNEAATKLLDDITLKTYHNSVYGYDLNYPPSWLVFEEDKSKIWIYPPNAKGGETFIYIHAISENDLSPFKGLQGYILAKLALLKSLNYEFNLVESTHTRLVYTYRLLKDSVKQEAKRYFVQNGSNVYEIVCSAEYTEITPFFGSKLFDPFESFRFQP